MRTSIKLHKENDNRKDSAYYNHQNECWSDIGAFTGVQEGLIDYSTANYDMICKPSTRVEAHPGLHDNGPDQLVDATLEDPFFYIGAVVRHPFLLRKGR